MQCPFCAAENLLGARYCERCGGDLKGRPPAGAPATQAPLPRLEPAPPPTPIFPNQAPSAQPLYAQTAPAPLVNAQPTPAPALNTPPAPRFLVFSPPQAPLPAAASQILRELSSGYQAAINVERLLLGRGPGAPGEGAKLDCEGLPQGATVSGRHALLSRDSLGFNIEDLGSANGTFLNGQRLPVGVQQPLRPGDVLSLGGVNLRWEVRAT